MIKTLDKFFKLTVYLNGKKYVYYGSNIKFISFNDKIKHEIIWNKSETLSKSTQSTIW